MGHRGFVCWFSIEQHFELSLSCLVSQSCPALVTPWTVTHQAPLSMGFSRREYWGGLPFPSPGDLSEAGIEPGSPAFHEKSLLSHPHSY